MQVVLGDEEHRAVETAAAAEGMTVSAWVRHVMWRARREQPSRHIGNRLEAVRAAADHDFPTADLPEMLRQVEQGYLSR